MKNDILVQTRFRNNILWGLMCGRSGAEVSCEIGIQNSQFLNLLNLKESPHSSRSKSRYTPSAERIAKHFKMLEEDLFPDSLYSLGLPSVIEREYDSQEVSLQLAGSMHSMLPSPQDVAESGEMIRDIQKALLMLRTRVARVIRMRFGIDGEVPHTLEEVAKELRITKERVRQIEMGGLRCLRHPKIAQLLNIHANGNENIHCEDVSGD